VLQALHGSEGPAEAVVTICASRCCGRKVSLLVVSTIVVTEADGEARQGRTLGSQCCKARASLQFQRVRLRLERAMCAARITRWHRGRGKIDWIVWKSESGT
jgi:hypothetical protein